MAEGTLSTGDLALMRDGGEFGGISIDFVTEKDGVLTIYTADSGPEGTNYQNYHLIDGEFYGGTVYASFYQAPY